MCVHLLSRALLCTRDHVRLEQALLAQTSEFWAIRDLLAKQCSQAMLRGVLEANSQPSMGGVDKYVQYLCAPRA